LQENSRDQRVDVQGADEESKDKEPSLNAENHAADSAASAVESSDEYENSQELYKDPCVSAAHRLHRMQIATLTVDLSEESNHGKPRKCLKGAKGWNACNLQNCLQQFAKNGRNSLAMVTGASDVYALDVDAGDGGLEAFEKMTMKHGVLPSDTPRAMTGNGGIHILFSLSASLEAGLKDGTNKTRIAYDGEIVGIDTRGEGGLLYIEPSAYKGCDGMLRTYCWDHKIEKDRSNLRAMPNWMIDILNTSGLKRR
jgi:hypothetical protein